MLAATAGAERMAAAKKQKEECSDAPQAVATAALEDGHDDEVTTSGDGGTNAALGGAGLEKRGEQERRSQHDSPTPVWTELHVRGSRALDAALGRSPSLVLEV